ncbi:MAG TPA: glycosyl hydrolase family 18 protein, partial [Thermomicrobiaceae bacterium]|nr:glycosyl hydrolase family 18 protein [Thermomicrobiaceae bacterium]
MTTRRARPLVLTILAALLVSLLPALRPAPAAARTANLRWAYYVPYDATSLTSLEANIGQLDVVSPDFYQLKSDGTIKDSSQPGALAVMREAGVMIIPMISSQVSGNDFHNTMATTAQRQAIAQEIANLVTSNGYAGINIDFEGVNPSDGPILDDFMQRLAALLHPIGKLVTQALPARTSDAPSNWAGAYDYATLGTIDDYVDIMTYDFHWQGDPTPGPIAPLPWVKSVIDYAKTQIPAPDILVGMPLYGYDWDLKAGPPAAAFGYAGATSLLTQPGATSGYDTTSQAPWIQYTDSSGHPHAVWYSNAQSLNAELGLMQSEDVGGFALWRLGLEDPKDWAEIASIATPATRIPPFTSTPDHTYFAVTGHSLSYGFQTFWQQNGGLSVFGYPQTEEFSEASLDTGQTYTVQYFERQRFEYHPDFAGTPYAVELGRLGAEEAAAQHLLSTPPFRALASPPPSTPGCQFFPTTGHQVCGAFLAYWQSHGLQFGDPTITYRESLALFGYPLSEPFTDPTTGYVTQYFERAVFEYH